MRTPPAVLSPGVNMGTFCFFATGLVHVTPRGARKSRMSPLPYTLSLVGDEGRARRRFEETTVSRALSTSPERRERFETSSGIPVQRVYTEEDLASLVPETDLGFPGEFPYTRGVHPTMYRSRFWTMRQYSGFGTAAETNRRFRYLLEQGQTGLSVAFDLPTQMGYDSD